MIDKVDVITKFMENLQNEVLELKKEADLIESIIYLSGSFIWLKGVDSKYIYCDKKWKRVFFAKDEEFDIVGRTDIDLLNEYRKNVNPVHDYGELCLSTDVHSNERKEKCRYLEGGFIGNQLFILDVTKTPMLDDDDNVIGNIGFAVDRSNQVTQVISEIETAKKLDLIQQLTPSDYNSSPFVYWMKYSNDFKLRDVK